MSNNAKLALAMGAAFMFGGINHNGPYPYDESPGQPGKRSTLSRKDEKRRQAKNKQSKLSRRRNR